MRLLRLLSVMMLLSLGQCGTYDTVAIVHSVGASGLHCNDDQVVVRESAGGTYVAQGCGRWTEYDCVHVHYGFACLPHHAVVHDGPPPPPASFPPGTFHDDL
jgi:hypothetical protein